MSESVGEKEINIMKSEDLPDYEKNRLKNIAEQKAMFLVSLKKRALALSATTKPKSISKSPTSRTVSDFFRRKIVKKKYTTRSSVKKNSDDCSEEVSKKRPLEEDDEYSISEEYVELPAKKRRCMPSRSVVN